MDTTQQSNAIFFFLIAAFIIFITMRGELPTYLGFLVGGSSSAPAATSDAGSDAANTALAVGKTALQVLPLL
jgi:hypothetical protein